MLSPGFALFSVCVISRLTIILLSKKRLAVCLLCSSVIVCLCDSVPLIVYVILPVSLGRQALGTYKLMEV